MDKNNLHPPLGGYSFEQLMLEQPASFYSDTSHCMTLISEKGKVLQINQAGLALLEADSHQDVINISFLHFIEKNSRAAFKEFSINLINEERGDIRYVLTGLKGTLSQLAMHATPVRDKSGKVCAILGSSRKVNIETQQQKALAESEKRFRLLSEAIPQQVWTATPSGKLNFLNKRVFDYFGLPEHQILKSGWQRFIHPDDLNNVVTQWRKSLVSGKPYRIDFRLRRADGEYRWHVGKALPVHDDHGDISEWFGTSTDIHDLKYTHQELLTTSQLLDESQHVAGVGGWELDIATGKLFWTTETYLLHDTTPDKFNPTIDAGVDFYLPESKKILNLAIKAAIEEGIDYDLELETYTTKGRKIDVRVTCRVTRHKGEIIKLTGIFQDISEYKAIQRELQNANKSLEDANIVLEYIAHYDSLTRLPNRTLLADKLQEAMASGLRRNKSTVVAFLDLDGFKEINDTHGHCDGDELLIQLADRMQQTLRENDTLARIGGDEFVAVFTDITNPEDYKPLIEKLLEAASDAVIVRENNLQISTSIGVTIYPQDDADAEQLLRHADQAMYLAKQAGKNCYHLFDVAQDTAKKNHLEEIENIRSALKNNELVLFYQPKVNMLTGDVVGAEALIRWQHPSKGLLPPADFLPFIEEHILSIDIGEWVITTALQQIKTWKQAGLEIPISVNIGALQLQQDNFITRLKIIMGQFPDTKPHSLELEILETSALEDINQVSSVIKTCQEMNVNCSLDDFGTGYSSLSYLKQLPAKTLKIDRSFVRDALDDADDLAIIQGIIGLAKAFNREVIAEGVETIGHGEILLSLGCTYAQGYGIARPMPAEKIPAWAKSWQPDSAWTQTKKTRDNR